MALSFTSAKSEERGGHRRRWPVLARFPDVMHAGSAVPSEYHPGPERVERRIDPPQSADASEEMKSRTPRPHAFRATSARRSPILPDTNPFVIPAPRLYRRLTPILRFLVLFSLVTVAGTAVITIRRGEKSPAVKAAPRMTSRKTLPQRAELTLDVEPAGQRVEQPPAESSAGPTEARLKTIESSTTSPAAVGPLGARRLPDPPHSEVETPTFAPQLISASGEAMPRVQTSNPGNESAAARAGNAAMPSAIARLPGYLLPSPERQAQHDDHQPSLY